MLKWVFGADTSPFRKGLGQMRSQTKALASSLGGVLIGALGLNAIIQGFRTVFREMDRVQKLGLRFGETAETIQRVSQVAELSGTNIEAVAKAMQTATRNAMEASNGLKSYKEAFDALGINTDEFINMPMEDKLVVLSRALENVEGEGEKVALIMKTMGGRATELIPLLNMSSKELQDMMNQVPVASQYAVDSIARMNDAWTRFTTEMKVSMAESVPYISMIWNGLMFYITTYFQTAKIVLDAVARLSVNHLKVVGKALSGNLIGAGAAFVDYKNISKNALEEIRQNAEQNYNHLKELLKPPTSDSKGKSGPFDPEDTAEIDRKTKAIDRLKEKLRDMRQEEELAKADNTKKIKILEDRQVTAETNRIRYSGEDEEKSLEAEIEFFEIQKQIDAVKKQMATDEEKATTNRQTALENIAQLERDIELSKLSTAEKILELEKERAALAEKASAGDDEASLEAQAKALELTKEINALTEQDKKEKESVAKEVKEKMDDIEDLANKGPSIQASSLAAVGGGGAVAMFGQEAIEKKKVDLLSEIRDLLRTGGEGAPDTPIEPAA